MKGSGVSLAKEYRHFPSWQPPERQLQRNYFTMRYDFFQALYDVERRMFSINLSNHIDFCRSITYT